MKRWKARGGLILLLLIGGARAHAQLKGYDLSRPLKLLELPDTLREVSGITLLAKHRIACVQDEQGIIFTYDLDEARIVSEVAFGVKGDYEGIARAGDAFYVLRSDGMLFHVATQKPVDSLSTGIPAKDNEGLCYDPIGKRLLIASKSKPAKDPGQKSSRYIYALDPKSGKMEERAVYHFQVPELRQFVDSSGIALSQKLRRNGSLIKVLHFTPSAIAIHPLTHELYLVSSADHLLFVFDRAGKPLRVAKLDEQLCPKPEGLTFLKNGDMIISSEGRQQKANLVWFRYWK